MDATTEPEQAQEAFSRIKYQERQALQADIDEFLERGGEIQQLAPYDAGIDAAEPQTPQERFGETERMQQMGLKRQKPTGTNQGRNQRKLLKVIRENPGATSTDIQRLAGAKGDSVTGQLRDMEGKTICRGESVKGPSGQWMNTWYPLETKAQQWKEGRA